MGGNDSSDSPNAYAGHAPDVHNGGMNIDALRVCLSALAVFLVTWAPILPAQSEGNDYIRHAADKNGAPQALEVSITGFENGQGVRVDLVGAIHVADRRYFGDLDRRLADYEVVLYELVGEPGQVTAPRSGSPSMIGLMQGGMKNALGLAFQLDEIDYGRDNMVHADLTPSAFAASMRDRNESFLGMIFRAWAMALAEQGSGKAAGQDAAFIKALFANDRQLALKRVLAEQLSSQTELLESLAGDDGSTLITVRNQRALEVLREQLDAGARDIAIFYGAGHMPDFETRLVDDFGMRRVSTEWIEAWDLR